MCPDAQGLQTLFLLLLSLERVKPGWVWSCSREGRGGEVVQTPRDSKFCSSASFSREITLVESGHAVGRGGMGKFYPRH